MGIIENHPLIDEENERTMLLGQSVQAQHHQSTATTGGHQHHGNENVDQPTHIHSLFFRPSSVLLLLPSFVLYLSSLICVDFVFFFVYFVFYVKICFFKGSVNCWFGFMFC